MRNGAAILSVLFCIAAGVYLLSITPAQENNIVAALAHGIGIYCVGKGFYCGADRWRERPKTTPPASRMVEAGAASETAETRE